MTLTAIKHMYAYQRCLKKLNRVKGTSYNRLQIRALYYLSVKGPSTLAGLIVLSAWHWLSIALNKLIDAGNIAYDGKLYSITPAGTALLHEYNEMLRRFRLDRVRG